MIPQPPAIIYRVSDRFDIEQMLVAISAVESGHDDDAVGEAGELSRYQITPGLWRQYMVLPYGCAIYWPNAHCCAFRVVRAWIGQLRARGVPDDLMPDIVAQWWNCGQSAAPTRAKRERIQRIVNLYWDSHGR